MVQNALKNVKMKNIVRWMVILPILFFAIAFFANEDVRKALFEKEKITLLESEYGFDKVKVTKVVDGDTITVKFSDGTEEKVRMIGVNTPESVHSDESKNTKEGEIASNWSKAYLQNETVYLQYDKEKEDKYGRILAYVWIYGDCNPNDYLDFCKYNYGAILMKNTYCEAVYYEPNGMYKDWYEKLDAEYNYGE